MDCIKRKWARTMNKEKKLIVFEGISGAGKSTIINLLMRRLENVDGINVKMSSLMDDVQKTNSVDFKNSKYYLLLEELKTILFEDSTKELIVFERYYISALAHAYALNKIDNNPTIYNELFKWYTNNIGNRLTMPDIYIVFDLPLDVSLARIQKRNQKVTDEIWIDKDYLLFCEEYKNNFLKNVESNIKVFRIDANNDIEYVYNEVIKILKELEA